MDAREDGLVSDRFAVAELLGSGGSASVFAALDTASGDRIALKVLHPHLSRSALAREAFFVEARAAEVLRHPNIVAVLGYGVHGADGDALAWIALELAPGLTLAEHVEQYGVLAWREALAVADGVLRALEVAHAAGVIHRDISPANVMVGPGAGVGAGAAITADAVRLVDFGLADAAGRPALGSDILRTGVVTEVLPNGAPETIAGQEQAAVELPAIGVLGSVNYMSPEQASGRPVDERGDLYQVGALLHFALTGQPPFVRSTVTGVMRAHVSAPPPVPSALGRRVPRGVDRLVVRALLKDPAGRQPSAAAMRAEVAELAVRATIAAASAPAPARSPAPLTATASEPPAPLALPAEAKGRTSTRGLAVAAAVLTATVVAVVWTFSLGGAPGSTSAAPRSTAETSLEPAMQTSSPATPPVDVAAAVAGSPAGSPPATGATVPVLPLVQLPDLFGLGFAEAERRLVVAGLAVGGVSTRDAPAEAGTVLASTPTAAVALAPGSAVDLVVASGSNVVPPVAGLGPSDAITIIQSAGFAVTVAERVVQGARVGLVVRSEPAAPAVLTLGSTVTVTVAAANPSTTPAAPSMPPTQQPAPTSTPAPTAGAR